jgi:UDP-glucose 4-epimerase
MRSEILVTGGAGFIGAHTVVALYEAGFEPIILDNFSNTHAEMLEGIASIIGVKPTTYSQDCCDAEAVEVVFKSHQIKGVIHFAAFKSVAESVAEPEKYKYNNLQSLATILNAMQKNNVDHFVFSSSATVYGQPDMNPVDENTAWKEAASPYGWTKQQGEISIHQFKKEYPNFSAALLRYFNPIGAHPSGYIGEYPIGIPNNLIPLVNQAALGLRILKIFGSDYNTPDGTCVRDYIHVMDLANAHVKALQWLENVSSTLEVFNLGQGKGDSVKEIIDMYQLANNITIPFEMAARRPGDVESIWADVTKAKEILDWQSQYTTYEALVHAHQFATRW